MSEPILGLLAAYKAKQQGGCEGSSRGLEVRNTVDDNNNDDNNNVIVASHDVSSQHLPSLGTALSTSSLIREDKKEEEEVIQDLPKTLVDNLNLLVNILNSLDSHTPIEIPQTYNIPMLLGTLIEKNKRNQLLRNKYTQSLEAVNKRLSELGLSQSKQQEITLLNPPQTDYRQLELERLGEWL